MVKFNDLKGLLSEIKNIIKKAEWELDLNITFYDEEISITFSSIIDDWYSISCRNNNITLVPPVEVDKELSVEEIKTLCEIMKILDANKELLDI